MTIFQFVQMFLLENFSREHSYCAFLSLVTVNTGIVNHTHSRMGSIMSTGIVQGRSTTSQRPKQCCPTEKYHAHVFSGNVEFIAVSFLLGATTGQSGLSSSGTYYPVTNQFTMGGAAISMASPMVIPSNTMHYGS